MSGRPIRCWDAIPNAPAGSGRSPTGGKTLRQGRDVAKVAHQRRTAAESCAAPKAMHVKAQSPSGRLSLAHQRQCNEEEAVFPRFAQWAAAYGAKA